MKEAILAMQRLIDWIDAHAVENPGLAEMSRQIGYSPYYCSEQFHRIAGITIKEYMARRRLSLAAIAIRDTDRPLLDIALDYGFSSQSALTRAFVNAFGCTPAAYRRNPTPIPMQIRKCIVSPSESILKGDIEMSNLVLPSYRMEYIPKHKYLGVYKPSETANGPIWPGHDCDLLCGIISSMTDTHPIVTGMTAGWKWDGEEKTYFFGAGVECDYAGEIPEGFELHEHVKLGTLPADGYLKDQATSVITGEGELRLDREGLHYEGTKDGAPFAFTIPSRQLPTYGMCTDVSRFYTFVDGEFCEFYPERESAELWMLATEELHRLNGGQWQDFPWKREE